MRILIADDDRISRLVLRTALTDLGHDVYDASDGQEALELLGQENAPRLAIVDWVMPKLDGLEVCKRLRQRRGSYVYVILLTARSARAEMVAAFDADVDDFLAKPFDKSELRARLRSGARVLELQEDLLRAQDNLRALASRDHLTGILNRGTIAEFLQMELARSSRQPADLSIIMVDLDRFKPVNDMHGHQVGDEALRSVVRRMQATMRPHDAIGRYGGDEFLIVLPGCDADMAREIASRLLRKVSDGPIRVGRHELELSVSVGAATKSGASETVETLIARADAALYSAKRLEPVS